MDAESGIHGQGRRVAEMQPFGTPAVGGGMLAVGNVDLTLIKIKKDYLAIRAGVLERFFHVLASKMGSALSNAPNVGFLPRGDSAHSVRCITSVMWRQG